VLRVFRPFTDPAVQAVFDSYPPAPRQRLLQLRDLIFDAARTIAAHSPLIETLKWGQPSYLPAKPRIGTTVRIDALKGSDDGYALYVPCQTTLIAGFRERYPAIFSFSGNRAILLSTREQVPQTELRHCIAMALGYHLKASNL
jgi:Domain of unknown function (DU1801)